MTDQKVFDEAIENYARSFLHVFEMCYKTKEEE